MNTLPSAESVRNALSAAFPELEGKPISPQVVRDRATATLTETVVIDAWRTFPQVDHADLGVRTEALAGYYRTLMEEAGQAKPCYLPDETAIRMALTPADQYGRGSREGLLVSSWCLRKEWELGRACGVMGLPYGVAYEGFVQAVNETRAFSWVVHEGYLHAAEQYGRIVQTATGRPPLHPGPAVPSQQRRATPASGGESRLAKFDKFLGAVEQEWSQQGHSTAKLQGVRNVVDALGQRAAGAKVTDWTSRALFGATIPELIERGEEAKAAEEQERQRRREEAEAEERRLQAERDRVRQIRAKIVAGEDITTSEAALLTDWSNREVAETNLRAQQQAAEATLRAARITAQATADAQEEAARLAEEQLKATKAGNKLLDDIDQRQWTSRRDRIF